MRVAQSGVTPAVSPGWIFDRLEPQRGPRDIVSLFGGTLEPTLAPEVRRALHADWEQRAWRYRTEASYEAFMGLVEWELAHLSPWLVPTCWVLVPPHFDVQVARSAPDFPGASPGGLLVRPHHAGFMARPHQGGALIKDVY